MEITELNQIRDRVRREFYNRVPLDEKTVFIYVGTKSTGIDENALKLFNSLVDAVADKNIDNVKVCFEAKLEGVSIASQEKIRSYTVADASDAAKFVAEHVAK